MHTATEVVECTEYKVCLVVPTEIECGAGSANLSSGMDTTQNVQTQIMSTILITLCTSCVAVISTLLELTATIAMRMKIGGGASDAAQLEVSESSAAV